jgi:rhamnose utilization protein RhaD (predicted bifunctional aldolase and dehydrogenase)
MSIKELVKISRFYGKDPSFLLAGGGNTSFKDKRYIFVKASGFELASIEEDGFVKLDRNILESILEKEYPANIDLRERLVLQDLMDSRVSGETKRPSVESLLHAILPWKYIIHTHPAIVNGLTCSKNGHHIAEKLFNSRCIWIPYVTPGYILAKLVKTRMAEYKKEHESLPDIILLGNHGLIVGAENLGEIENIHDFIIKTLKKQIACEPDFSLLQVSKEEIEKVYNYIKNYPAFKDIYITFENNTEISKVVKDSTSFKKVHSSYTPNHIVYAGPEMLFIENLGSIKRDIDRYSKRNGCYPKVIAVKMLGVFTIGIKESTSRIAMLSFLDALKIAIYTESFGGYKFMDRKQIDFIKSWGVEEFRSEIILDKRSNTKKDTKRDAFKRRRD